MFTTELHIRPERRAEGYQTVSSLTVQPDKGPGRGEREELKRGAHEGLYGPNPGRCAARGWSAPYSTPPPSGFSCVGSLSAQGKRQK